MTFFMGSIMLLAGAGDVRMLVRGGVFGAKRIARHLWRMCFGLFIAAGSFFLGPSNRPLRLLSAVGLGQHLSPALFSTPLYLFLSVLPLVLLIFWLVRVRFRNAFQGVDTTRIRKSGFNAMTGRLKPAVRSSPSPCSDCGRITATPKLGAGVAMKWQGGRYRRKLGVFSIQPSESMGYGGRYEGLRVSRARAFSSQ